MNTQASHWGGPFLKRDWAITTRVMAGEAMSAVGLDYKISTSRIQQITHRVCRRVYPDLYQEARFDSGDGDRPLLKHLRQHMCWLFTGEHNMSENPIPYTPIKGYRELNQNEIEEINKLKELEAEVLSSIDRLREAAFYETRWLAIGQTHIEQGFMALARSVAKPAPLPPRLPGELGQHSVG